MTGGLGYASGIRDGTVAATLAVDNWWVHLPIKHDDTKSYDTKGDVQARGLETRNGHGRFRPPNP